MPLLELMKSITHVEIYRLIKIATTFILIFQKDIYDITVHCCCLLYFTNNVKIF